MNKKQEKEVQKLIDEYRDTWTALKEHDERQTIDERYAQYWEILNKMFDIHIAKDHDYAGEDYLSNLKGSERLGIPAWKGTLIRIEDKIARLENFAKTEQLLVDESVEDTLLDLANYAILALILYRNQ